MLATNSYLRCSQPHLKQRPKMLPSICISYHSDEALKESAENRTHYIGHDYPVEVEHWAPSPAECFSILQHETGLG